jgi:hypothetical protein
MEEREFLKLGEGDNSDDGSEHVCYSAVIAILCGWETTESDSYQYPFLYSICSFLSSFSLLFFLFFLFLVFFPVEGQSGVAEPAGGSFFRESERDRRRG